MNRIGKEVLTQVTIAQAAKVHVSTVSLALRNDPRLPEATRRRIQEIARRLGYAPNPLVSMLMARVRRRNLGYRGAIAYLHTVPADEPKLAGAFYRNCRAGAKRRAAELGYSLDTLFLDGGAAAGRRIAAVLRARNVAGLVIQHIPGPSCPGRNLPFEVGPFAAVSVGVPLARPRLHYVANDQYMRAILAAGELTALGYRRLGLVMVNHYFDSAMAHRCSAGFWALGEYTTGVVALPICRIGRGETRLLRQWIRRHRPEAILTNYGGMLEMLREAGRRVPEDLGLAQLDWLPQHKPAAGVYGNGERTGAAAVELVVSQIHRGESGPPAHAMSLLVEGSWMPGTTVRRVGPPLDLDRLFFADMLQL